MKIDTYAIKARYTPAIFTIIPPVIIFNHFFTSAQLTELIGDFLAIEFLSNLTISGIFLYYFSQFSRFVGKELFEKCYFKEESHMPTTNFLMTNDQTFSQEYKERFKERVYEDFGFQLPTHSEQSDDEENARRRIVEVMALIRKKMFGNSFLLQHNIEYGAMRNAIGGSLLGLFLCIINIVFFKYIFEVHFSVVINVVLLIAYLILIAFSKVIINAYGRSYAKVLFREYMGIGD